MIVGFKGLRETFTLARSSKQRPEQHPTSIISTGRSSTCTTTGSSGPTGRAAALVDFTVDFAFKNRVFEMLAGQVFDRALRKMIGAFEERARAALRRPAARGRGISSSSAHNAA